MRLRLGSTPSRDYFVYLVVLLTSHRAGILFDIRQCKDVHNLLEGNVGDLFGVLEPFPTICIDVEGERLKEATW